MTPHEKLVAIVSAMAVHYAIVNGRGSDWVASMVDEACRDDGVIPGTELSTALDMRRRELDAERAAQRVPVSDTPILDYVRKRMAE